MKKAREAKKNFEKWLSEPKIKIGEIPRRGDVIIQLFMDKIKTKLFTSGNILDGGRKVEIQPYPYGVVLKANPEDEEYKEGDVIYLTDNILLTKENDEWLSWREKFENQKPTPHEPEPPRMVGGLNELDLFRFKRNKFHTESEEIDEELYQIPFRIIKGKLDI